MYNPPYLIFDYETENTHTERSRTFEQTTAQTDRHTAGIRFPSLFQPLCDKEGGRHEYLYRVRSLVESGHDLADPHCGMELEALRTRKSVFSENEYFSIVTTSKQYQVIRFFFVKSRYKAGQAAEYSIFEVVQRWIAPNGKTTTIARLRGMSIMYYDLWNECSDMEVRKCQEYRAYDINPTCTYPRQRFIPELKRNGFKGECCRILPYDLFKAILSDSRVETLMKAGQYPMLRYYLNRSFDMERYWASVKICIRNGYTISDGSMWRDTIDLLRHFGKDTNSPKYVCPSDLKPNTTNWCRNATDRGSVSS